MKRALSFVLPLATAICCSVPATQAHPTNLVLRGTWHSSPRGDALGLTVAPPHAYVANGAEGLLVFSVTNVEDPVLIGSYDTTAYAYDVVVASNRAYVAVGDSGLQVFDLSDPTHPSLLGTCRLFDLAVTLR